MPILWRWVREKSKVLIDNAAMLYDNGKIDGLLPVQKVYKN